MNQSNFSMIPRYLSIARRQLGRSKAFSLINIVGLSIGLVAFVLMVSFVSFESSFDNFHVNRDRLYRSEEHTSELQSQFHLVCRLLLEKKKKKKPFHNQHTDIKQIAL